MKKALSLIVVIALIFSFCITASATNDATLNGSDSVTVGDNIEFTLNVSGCGDATSIAVAVSYDSNFELVSGTWLKSGMINNFDTAKNKGALGGLASPDVNGDVFKLVLTAKTASASAKNVSINFIAKNGSTEIMNVTPEKSVKVNCATHSGGEATCVAKAKCAVCGVEYGETDPNNHNYEDKVVPPTCAEKGYTVHTCKDCGNEVKDTYTEAIGHKGGTATCKDKAVCSVCKQPYGDFAADNYGDLIKEEPADHNNEGMKAHYECSVCGKLFTESKVETTKEALIIPKVAHEYGNWKSNEGDHWKECDCGNIIDKAPHSGGEATCTSQAICSVCGVQYGEVNASNHKHTEVRDAKDATCCEAGYTGDTWCTDCNTKIANGTVIPATGKHVDVDGRWETDGSNHWHTCYFSTKFDVTAHSGGEATCTSQAICSVCGVKYGEKNPANHTGGTEIKDALEAKCNAEGYTGDTYCKGCGVKIADGKAIDKIPHIVTEWTVTKEATAKESGTKTGKCTVCGEEITAETGKLISKVEGDSAKVEAVGDTTLYENIILKTDKVGDKLSDTDKADMQAKIEALKLAVENIKMAEIFDISLFLRDTDASGNPIQDLKYEPNGKIRITMEVPEAIFKNFKNVKLLHFLDDGTVETVDYILDGSKAVFDTESLSYFAFAGTPIVTETGSITDNGTKNENNGQASSPQTGDSSNPIVWIAVLLVSALTVGTVSVYSRKKNCRACKK